MTQVAVLNRSKLDDALVALCVEAVNLQMGRDVSPAWGGPEVMPATPVRFYARAEGLPVASGAAVVCTIVDSMDPGVLGFHADQLGVQFLRIGANGERTCETLSHEVIEWAGDPTCDRWSRLPAGLIGEWTHLATELCDPCQGDTYLVEVSLFGRRMSLPVSDFLLPSYFDPNGKRPFTFLDTIDRPFGLSRNGGGYRALLNERTGRMDNVYGAGDERGRRAAEKKLENPHARVSRLMAAAPRF